MSQGTKPVALSSPSVFSCVPEYASPVSPGLGLDYLDHWLLSPLPAKSAAIAQTSGLECTMLPRDADGCCALGSHPLLLGQQELEAGGGSCKKIGIQWSRPVVCDAYYSCLKYMPFHGFRTALVFFMESKQGLSGISLVDKFELGRETPNSNCRSPITSLFCLFSNL